LPHIPIAMSPDPQPDPFSPAHRYDLFDQGRVVAALEWRSLPRELAGWYLLRAPEPALRLQVDPGVDELARDRHSDDRSWLLHAQVAAILSTAMAVDAAGRELHAAPRRTGGRFRRLASAARHEIYLNGVPPEVVARAVPELAITSVSDVTVLEGRLLGDAVPVVIRRLELLGGTIITVLREDPGVDDA
jgi:hypothetical protein